VAIYTCTRCGKKTWHPANADRHAAACRAERHVATLVAMCTECDWTSRPSKASDTHAVDTGHKVAYAVDG
jgi:hypothetical protein